MIAQSPLCKSETEKVYDDRGNTLSYQLERAKVDLQISLWYLQLATGM